MLKEIFTALVCACMVFLVISLAPMMFLPADANVEANTEMTPVFVRPPWYLMAPYMVLRAIPNAVMAAGIQLLLIAAFILWPFIDKKEERDIRRRPVLLAVFITASVLWFLLTFWERL